MVHALDERRHAYQALIDSGLADEQAKRCQSLIAANRDGEALAMLRAHRRAIVSELHRCGRQIDCLDYVIASLKESKQRKGSVS